MKQGMSQEALKITACLTMLIDHIGYGILYPMYSGLLHLSVDMSREAELLYAAYILCRCIGRISFPIFAFLLVEGMQHTRSRKNYALRLSVCAVVSEIPYNLMVSGSISCGYQSVMATLLLGFLAVHYMEKCPSLAWKPVVLLPFAVLAEVFRVDYGWEGILLIGLFALSREMYNPNLVRTGGMIVLFHLMPSQIFWIGNISLPMQVLGVLSMVFIAAYDGRKLTASKAAQWGFYLFYPAHLLLIWALGMLLPWAAGLGSGIAI